MSELKPCPLCGGDPVLDHIKQYSYRIGCLKCRLFIEQTVLKLSMEWLKKKMIESWNTRVETDVKK